jgi:hypothetical protein
MQRSWLIPATIVLMIAAGFRPAHAQVLVPPDPTPDLLANLANDVPTPVTVTGRLVDHACFSHVGGDPARAADLTKCQEGSARKGARLAIVSPAGTFFIAGSWADNNNKRLLPLLDHTVVATGLVTQIDVAARDAVPDPPVDKRRNPKHDGETKKETTRRGDYREGDPRAGVALFIDAATVIDLSLAK